jgi:hypothetical protein
MLGVLRSSEIINAGVDKAVEETPKFALGVIKGGLGVFDPRRIKQMVDTEVEKYAGSEGFKSQEMSKDTSDRNAELAEKIGKAYASKKIPKDKALFLLQGLPQSQTSDDESKFEAFINGAMIGADAVGWAGIVSDVASMFPGRSAKALTKGRTPGPRAGHPEDKTFLYSDDQQKAFKADEEYFEEQIKNLKTEQQKFDRPKTTLP